MGEKTPEQWHAASANARARAQRMLRRAHEARGRGEYEAACVLLDSAGRCAAEAYAALMRSIDDDPERKARLACDTVRADIDTVLEVQLMLGMEVDDA